MEVQEEVDGLKNASLKNDRYGYTIIYAVIRMMLRMMMTFLRKRRILYEATRKMMSFLWNQLIKQRFLFYCHRLLGLGNSYGSQSIQKKIARMVKFNVYLTKSSYEGGNVEGDEGSNM